MEWNSESLKECLVAERNKYDDGVVDCDDSDLTVVKLFMKDVKSRWVGMPDAKKEETKRLIASMMIYSIPKTHALLIEILNVIQNLDFPNLPELKSGLDKAINGNDFPSINAILATVNSLFRKLRTTTSLFDLKYCSDHFAETLLNTVEIISSSVNMNHNHNAAAVIESQRLCCRIFYSLNFFHLLEDNADKLMNHFMNYVTMTYPSWSVVQQDIVDALRAAAFSNLSLYMLKDENLFQNNNNMARFVDAVRSLLVVTSPCSIRDRLTLTAIKFLTIVSTSNIHRDLLISGDDQILHQITHVILFPFLMLRDEDVELFQTNYPEFVRWNIDLNTRRNIASEFLRGIARNYNQKVINQSLSAQITACLELFSHNPAANWKHKECAIYVLHSLGASLSTRVVDVESFFTLVIMPELQDVNSLPMLKAAALMFVTTFRDLIPRPLSLNLLAPFLTSDVNAVRSVAATCIEKLLPRYTSSDISPLFPLLMTHLVDALGKPGSQDNQYITSCISRLVQTAAADTTTPMPTPPNMPCPLQLIVQRLDFNSPQNYVRLLDIILRAPNLWEDSANVPHLLRLLHSLLQLAPPPNEPNRERTLKVVLGVSNSLVSSPSTEQQGFHILNQVIEESFGYGFTVEYMTRIFSSLFTRLQRSKTPGLVRFLIIFMSRFLVKHGIQTLVDSINSLQVDLFHLVLGRFWIPNLKTITGYKEVKASTVASSKLLCESPTLLEPAAEDLWGKLLDSIVTLVSQPELHDEERLKDPLMDEITMDPKHYSVTLLANLSYQFPGRFQPIISRYLSPPNQAALLDLCNFYNLSIV